MPIDQQLSLIPTVKSKQPNESAVKEELKKRIREVSYTMYGGNLEQTLKLLTCQKTISLIDKRDPKYRRMFITAAHYKQS